MADNMIETRSFLTYLWLAIGPVLTIGCSGGDQPELGEVTGVVTLDGDPVVGAHLTFVPTEATPVKILAYGVTDAYGRYEAVFRDNVKGVPTGMRQVRIYSDEGTTWRGVEWLANRRREFFPPRYNERTELLLDVKPGKNAADFHCHPNGTKK